MAELLFIQPSDMTETSVLGGNIDYDKLTFHISFVQVSVIEPLLGTELYDKIIADKTASTITGVYLTIFEEFVQPITRNMAIAEFVEVASYTLNNGGLFRKASTDTTEVDKEEAQFLAGKYRAAGQMFVQRFKKFICKNVVPEYKRVQDEVDADKNLTLTAGWYLGDAPRKDDDDFGGGTSGDFLLLD